MTTRDKIVSKIDAQVQKGVSKYGVGVDDASLPAAEWLDHLEQELIDGLFYIEQIRKKLEVDKLGFCAYYKEEGNGH